MAYKMKKPQKLNLIPILDAIFIFIFFLLMSAQFIDIYEIGSDAPMVSSSENIKDKKKPLNLLLHLKADRVIIKTGLNETILKTVPLSDLKLLNTTLLELKKKYPKETNAIIRPDQNFKYNDIIKVIDSTKKITIANSFLKTPKGLSTDLFNNVIFDTQD